MFSYSTGYYVSPPIDQYLKFKNRCSLVYTEADVWGVPERAGILLSLAHGLAAAGGGGG